MARIVAAIEAESKLVSAGEVADYLRYLAMVDDAATWAIEEKEPGMTVQRIHEINVECWSDDRGDAVEQLSDDGDRAIALGGELDPDFDVRPARRARKK